MEGFNAHISFGDGLGWNEMTAARVVDEDHSLKKTEYSFLMFESSAFEITS